MSKRSRSSRHMISVDLTSMIDVVFQLIIFFMFTSQFGELRRTEVDLPKQPGDEAEVKREPAFIIDLLIDGQYLVESKPATIDEIRSIARSGVAKATVDKPFDVLVRPDQHAPAVFLDRILLQLSEVGVVDWKLATEKEAGS